MYLCSYIILQYFDKKIHQKNYYFKIIYTILPNNINLFFLPKSTDLTDKGS